MSSGFFACCSSAASNMVQLYGNPISLNSFRSNFYLAERAAADSKFSYEFTTIDLRKGGHKETEYLKKNPRGQVPCLEDDGTFVSESLAIILYVENTHGKVLTPSNPDEAGNAFTRAMQVFTKVDGDNTYGSLAFMGKTNKDPVVREKLEKRLKEWKTWDAIFGEGKYVAGDNFSFADCALFPHAVMDVTLGLPLGDYPNLARWYKELRARPTAEEAHVEAMEQFFSEAGKGTPYKL
eukprot:GFYU01010735.1.p1 GENE.GFYU01010735.1~~GFYU01010735.1.p1  ORF type:complete len:237 (-),score=70.47 GFYU01010735.1:112-822(-)